MQDMEKYEIIRRLGQGGCAVVYLVKSAENGRLFAMKQIQLDATRKSRTKDNVLKEARILGRLKYPHIVVLHDSFFDPKDEYLCIIQDRSTHIDGNARYTLDYCDGGTIDDKIQEKKKEHSFLDENEILKWFLQVVMAVQYIHSNKILHRDLKSQNVFLMKNGIAKLGDFGIAKAMDSTLDMAQTCVGTPCYLSPEVCQDLPYSSKADMWSLGCLLYEMCSLTYAFEAANLLSLYYKIVKGEYKPLNERYSRSLVEIVDKLLSKSPDDRPSATSILSNPFIHSKLSEFVLEFKHMQEAISARQQLRHNRPASASSNRNSSITRNSINNRSKSAIGMRNTSLQNEKDLNCKPLISGGEVMVSAKETGDYVDDFMEESDSDYSDDFDDEAVDQELAAVDKEAAIQSEIKNGAANENTKESGVIAEYPDDFEEVEEEDEQDIEEIVGNVEDILQGREEVCEDVIEDERMEGVSNIAFVKEQCRECLGEQIFGEVEQICKEGFDTECLRPEFQRIAGSELLETCYLVNELVINDHLGSK